MTDPTFRRLSLGLLALNTFLLCALAGAGLAFLRKGPAVAAARLPLAGEQLPGAERAAFQQALAEARRTVRATGLEAQQARIEAAGLLGQPHPDAAALGDALRRAREAEGAVREAVEQRAVAFVAGLPLEERRRLAAGLIQREAPQPAAK